MKKKILFIQPKVPDYRIPIFNGLTQRYDITIMHSGIIVKDVLFDQIKVTHLRIGPFFVSNKNLHKICKEFDVVISEGNIRFFDRYFLIINPFRKYKFIFWTIGVSASYHKKFDEDRRLDFFKFWLFKFADALIFYTSYPIKKYVDAGFSEDSLFVANNTTLVSYNTNVNYLKDSIMFIGTLYKQKKIYELLHAYEKAYNVLKNDTLPLIIIGEGIEYDGIKDWIKNKHLEHKVSLTGAIYNPKQLEVYFRKAYACISPNQAGLSVLTSMGYGTPFITKKDAITGGEIFNIKEGVNGVLFDDFNELEDIIIDINKEREKYMKYGENARKFYINNRLPKDMINGMISAIEFVLKGE